MSLLENFSIPPAVINKLLSMMGQDPIEKQSKQCFDMQQTLTGWFQRKKELLPAAEGNELVLMFKENSGWLFMLPCEVDFQGNMVTVHMDHAINITKLSQNIPVAQVLTLIYAGGEGDEGQAQVLDVLATAARLPQCRVVRKAAEYNEEVAAQVHAGTQEAEETPAEGTAQTTETEEHSPSGDEGEEVPLNILTEDDQRFLEELNDAVPEEAAANASEMNITALGAEEEEEDDDEALGSDDINDRPQTP